MWAPRISGRPSTRPVRIIWMLRRRMSETDPNTRPVPWSTGGGHGTAMVVMVVMAMG